ncbi:MAG: ribonuclease P protein component [Fibrobacterota bacterium]
MNSLSKKCILKNKGDIQRVLSRGKRRYTDSFTLIYAESTENHNRFAVLVSRKNGPAVDRVRIKRIYREVYKNCTPSHAGPCDILIRPRPGKNHSYGKVSGEYTAIWHPKM